PCPGGRGAGDAPSQEPRIRGAAGVRSRTQSRRVALESYEVRATGQLRPRRYAPTQTLGPLGAEETTSRTSAQTFLLQVRTIKLVAGSIAAQLSIDRIHDRMKRECCG